MSYRLGLVMMALAAVACSPDADAPATADAGVACAPRAGGPHWLEEGETLTLTIACTVGPERGPGELAFSVDPMPAGTSYDPATATLSWTPGLDQAAVYQLTLGVVGGAAADTGQVKIGVADAFDAPGNQPVVDPLAYPEEFGLPVLFLSPRPQDPELYTPATVVYRGHTYAAAGKKRGATSLAYPKNSYTLKFDRVDPFMEPAHGGAGGFVDKHKVVLLANFDDNSYVRQRLAYDMWDRMDADHLTIQTYSAVVYVDGAFVGLYTVADHVDKDLMLANGLDPDGNLYKALSHDANFRLVKKNGSPKVTLHDGYEKKEGLPLEGAPGAFDDLDALVAWVATADSPTFLAERATRIQVRDYEDWWVLMTFMLADDSAGKNSYHFHDPAGGPWRYAPWDLNHSLGQAYETSRVPAVAEEDYISMNGLFERFLAEPSIAGPLAERYRAVLDGTFAQDALLALVDGYVAEIDAVARRDERKWATAYRTYADWEWRTDFTTYEEEIAYLRTWIGARWAFLDEKY